MKEAFEKLKERLEEETYDMEICEEQFDANSPYFIDVPYKMVKLEDALSIVSEVEAEYINKSTEHINKSTEHINKSGDCSTNWIDVKDRLPENDGYYLTCDHKGNIHVFYHHPSYVANDSNTAFGICKNHPQFYQPIAWMELPKPYNRLERK